LNKLASNTVNKNYWRKRFKNCHSYVNYNS